MRNSTRKKKVVPRVSKRTKIGIVISDYYQEIAERLLLAAKSECREWGVAENDIRVVRVTGSFEIPYGALRLLEQEKVDGVITLGCLVKGETAHDEYIASAVSRALMDLVLRYEKPVAFGVITALNLKQAIARSRGEENKGKEAARATLSALTI